MGGCSDEEIADELHKTTTAINSLLFQARLELRAPLARALGIDVFSYPADKQLSSELNRLRAAPDAF